MDGRADIYALGSLAWCLMVNALPFEGGTIDQELARHVNEPVPPIPDPEHLIPASFQAVIARCLAKDLAARWQSATELRHALECIAFTHPWTVDDAESWWAGGAAQPTRAREMATAVL